MRNKQMFYILLKTNEGNKFWSGDDFTSNENKARKVHSRNVINSMIKEVRKLASIEQLHIDNIEVLEEAYDLSKLVNNNGMLWDIKEDAQEPETSEPFPLSSSVDEPKNFDERSRAEALARFLDVDINELEEGDIFAEFKHEGSEYLVLDDVDADQRAYEYIEQTVWAFNPSFLASHSKVNTEMFEALQKNELCEGNNDIILNCIDDFVDFVDCAIKTDDRGHFLNTYDGKEHCVSDNDGDEWYIYRIN